MSFTPTKPSGATIRGPSRQLWNKARWQEIQGDPSAGFGFFDDFLFIPEGKYEVTQATAGTFGLIDGDGGIARADSASSVDTQGVNVQLGGDEAGTTDANEMFKPEAGTEIIFEARLKVIDFGTAGDDLQFFLGLSVDETAIIGSSANASANHIGFEAIGTSAVTFVSEKGGTRGTIASVHTFLDGTDVTDGTEWVKLGFRVLGVTKVECWVNDARNATTIATANIPTTELTPSLVCQADGGGADEPEVHMDWWYTIKKNRIDTN